MYTIYADNICIHNDMIEVEELRVLSPSLEMSDCAAGSLSFTILPSNPGYSEIELFATTITVLKNGEWFWAGRPISESTDFYNQKTIECEGVLAFLNDTHQPSWVSDGDRTITEFITHLLFVHNGKVNENRKIRIGSITVNDGTKMRYTEYENTMDCFSDIVKDNGGHLMIRYDSENGYYRLDYLADWNNTNSQEIRFGSNLMDFTTDKSRDSFGTAIFPLGAELEDGSRVNISSVNSGSLYLQDATAVSKWGYIEKKFEDTDITSPATLKSVAQTVLNEMISEDISLEISAIDLSMLDNTIEDIRLYDQIRVVSPCHDLDTYFPVSSVSLDLAEPQNDTFTLGEEESVSLSSKTSSITGGGHNVDINGEMSDIGKYILNTAKLNATQIINNATNGYVTTVYNENGTSELYISDNINYRNATKLWRWNINGLGYSNDGGATYDLAITMTGDIVADFITTGTMSANRIRGGSIISQTNNTSWNLNTGELIMNKGSVNLGSSYKVNVTDTGELKFYNYDSQYSSPGLVGTIKGNAIIYDEDEQEYYYGPLIKAEANHSVIGFLSDDICVKHPEDAKYKNCGNGEITFVTDVTLINGQLTVYSSTIKVLNGFITSKLS